MQAIFLAAIVSAIKELLITRNISQIEKPESCYGYNRSSMECFMESGLSKHLVFSWDWSSSNITCFWSLYDVKHFFLCGYISQRFLFQGCNNYWDSWEKIIAILFLRMPEWNVHLACNQIWNSNQFLSLRKLITKYFRN